MTSNSTSDEEQQFLQTTSTGGQQETTNESQQRLVDAGILETSGHYCGGVEAQKGEAASDVSSLETAVDTLTSDMIIVEQEDSKDLHDDVSRFLRGDPSPLFELDKRAKDLVVKLDLMVNELHSNIDAMSICAHQAISLHSQSVDSLHDTVDSGVKVMYSFLSQFNELHETLKPINKLNEQMYPPGRF